MTRFRTGVVAAATTLVLAACGAGGAQPPKPAGSEAQGSLAQTITYAYGEEFTSYNVNTVLNLLIANIVPLYQVQSGFWYRNDKGEVVPNTDLGTYAKVSDDPLTVEYTFNDKAVWSDGVPLDCDDMLLFWAAKQGQVKAIAPLSDNPLIKTPECAKGDRKVTFVYNRPYSDWLIDAPENSGLLPAHIVAKQGGLSEEEFIAAIKAADNKKLKKAGDFFKTGWNVKGGLPAADLIPSSGPYKLTKYDAGQSLTLERNDKWWGKPAATPTIVERFVKPEEMAQALQNSEVDIIRPGVSPDVMQQLQEIAGTKVESGNTFSYNHMDFNFDSSPFKDLRVRQAFAKCVPRQLIVDNLIKPTAPEAQVLQLRNMMPFQPEYPQVLADAGAKDLYLQPDIEGAKALLQQAGKVGVEIKISHKTPDQINTQIVALTADSCDKAGFVIKDIGAEDAYDNAMWNNTYDIAMFSWVGSGQLGGLSATFGTLECTPEGKSSNTGCYSSKPADALMKQLDESLDWTQQTKLLGQIEKIFWDDLATLPLYSAPAITAWKDKVEGVVPHPSLLGWNMSTWVKHE